MLVNLNIKQKYYLQMGSAVLLALLVLLAGADVTARLKEHLAGQQQDLLLRQLEQVSRLTPGLNVAQTPQLQQQTRTLAEESRSALNARIDAAIATLLVVLAAAGAFTLMIISLISRAVCKPVHTVVDALQRVSNGDGDLSIRIPISGTNEAAQAAASYNRFADKMQKVVDEVVHVSARMEAER